eukprot:UN24825
MNNIADETEIDVEKTMDEELETQNEEIEVETAPNDTNETEMMDPETAGENNVEDNIEVTPKDGDISEELNSIYNQAPADVTENEPVSIVPTETKTSDTPEEDIAEDLKEAPEAPNQTEDVQNNENEKSVICAGAWENAEGEIGQPATEIPLTVPEISLPPVESENSAPPENSTTIDPEPENNEEFLNKSTPSTEVEESIIPTSTSQFEQPEIKGATISQIPESTDNVAEDNKIEQNVELTETTETLTHVQKNTEIDPFQTETENIENQNVEKEIEYSDHEHAVNEENQNEISEPSERHEHVVNEENQNETTEPQSEAHSYVNENHNTDAMEQESVQEPHEQLPSDSNLIDNVPIEVQNFPVETVVDEVNEESSHIINQQNNNASLEPLDSNETVPDIGSEINNEAPSNVESFNNEDPSNVETSLPVILQPQIGTTENENHDEHPSISTIEQTNLNADDNHSCDDNSAIADEKQSDSEPRNESNRDHRHAPASDQINDNNPSRDNSASVNESSERDNYDQNDNDNSYNDKGQSSFPAPQDAPSQSTTSNATKGFSTRNARNIGGFQGPEQTGTESVSENREEEKKKSGSSRSGSVGRRKRSSHSRSSSQEKRQRSESPRGTKNNNNNNKRRGDSRGRRGRSGSRSSSRGSRDKDSRSYTRSTSQSRSPSRGRQGRRRSYSPRGRRDRRAETNGNFRAVRDAKGEIKAVNERGFGFIRPSEDNNEDSIYFHCTALSNSHFQDIA